METETSNNSEEDVSPPSKGFFRRQSTFKDAVKRLPIEEYGKFIEEAKKSLYAINKIITFAGRILQSAFTIGQFDDPNHHALNEIEICLGDVSDHEVLEFLQDFQKDLSVFFLSPPL